jgi:hypothetical protein
MLTVDLRRQRPYPTLVAQQAGARTVAEPLMIKS